SLPLFQTLKKCIKKSDFHWTAEAKQAFQQLKRHLSDLPLLVAPKPQEELIMYLSAAYGAISAVMSRPDAAGRLQKWSIMLGEHNITYRPRTSIKGQILADFLNEMPGNASQGAGLILTNPEGVEFTYALRFQFATSNNEAEYEALVAGLRIATQMGVKNLHAFICVVPFVIMEVTEFVVIPFFTGITMGGGGWNLFASAANISFGVLDTWPFFLLAAAASPRMKAVIAIIISFIVLGTRSFRRFVNSRLFIPCMNPEIRMHSGAPFIRPVHRVLDVFFLLHKVRQERCFHVLVTIYALRGKFVKPYPGCPY
nr:reverse transcriptase domain-containing protein [Tanacetum cinerariifolium]